MANTSGAFGLSPVRHLNGAPWSGNTVKCYISAQYATALFVGDPILLSPTLAEKDVTGVHPTINKSAGTAGIIARGVIVSFEPNRDDLTKTYNPASTEGYAYVSMDEDVVYEIRGDGGGTLTKAVPGQNAVMIATTAGSTVTGLSGMNLDEGTTTAPNTTQNFTLHVIGIKDTADNALGSDAVYDVVLNTPTLAAGKYLGITAS
ncbi:MAG: hypothetical protein GY714_18065 [Desulfobacterales bacterium]|nr:hypothetical protein [Desulfobacterales bacterium]